MVLDGEDIKKLQDIFATKEEFGELKQEVKILKQDVTVLKLDVRTLKKDVSGLKEDLSDFKDQTMTNFDEVVKLLEEIKMEQVATNAALRRHDRTLDDHEHRIHHLEVTA